jgi:hypothetical protein
MYLSIRKLSFFLLCGLVMPWITRCVQPEREQKYYAIDSLVLEQVEYLSGNHATLKKQASVNAKQQDTLILQTDSALWAKELGIFSEINLMNRALYQGRYVIHDALQETSSNLLIREFTGAKDFPIRSLKIYYQDTPDKLRKLEAVYADSTALLTSKRFMIMEFTGLNNKNILTSYAITGEQKLFVGDTVRYTVKGTVQLN